MRLENSVDGATAVKVTKKFPTSHGTMVQGVLNQTDNTWKVKNTSTEEVLSSGVSTSPPQLLKNLKASLVAAGVVFDNEVRNRL